MFNCTVRISDWALYSFTRDQATFKISTEDKLLNVMLMISSSPTLCVVCFLHQCKVQRPDEEAEDPGQPLHLQPVLQRVSLPVWEGQAPLLLRPLRQHTTVSVHDPVRFDFRIKPDSRTKMKYVTSHFDICIQGKEEHWVLGLHVLADWRSRAAGNRRQPRPQLAPGQKLGWDPSSQWAARTKGTKVKSTEPFFLIRYLCPLAYYEWRLTTGVKLGFPYSTVRPSSRVQGTSRLFMTAKSLTTLPRLHRGVINSTACIKWSLFGVSVRTRWCRLWPSMWPVSWGRNTCNRLPSTWLRVTWTPTPPSRWCLCCLPELILWPVSRTLPKLIS